MYRGEHVSAVVAMSNKGVLYFNRVTRGVSAGTFDHFVINTLLSKLQPFHGQRRRKRCYIGQARSSSLDVNMWKTGLPKILSDLQGILPYCVKHNQYANARGSGGMTPGKC